MRKQYGQSFRLNSAANHHPVGLKAHDYGKEIYQTGKTKTSHAVYCYGSAALLQRPNNNAAGAGQWGCKASAASREDFIETNRIYHLQLNSLSIRLPVYLPTT